MNNKEELKREFKEKFDYGDDTPIDSYADWWLSRFSSYQNELREAIEKMKWHGNPELETNFNFNRNRALSEVLSLLTTKDGK